MVLIWVIEDDADYRETTAEAIATVIDDASVQTFASFDQAWSPDGPPGSNGPPGSTGRAGSMPDVVLMDLGLPGTGGIEGIRRIKRARPDAAVLVLTVFADDRRLFDALAAGANGYLLKGTPLGELIDAIDLVRRGGAALGPDVAGRVLGAAAVGGTATTDPPTVSDPPVGSPTERQRFGDPIERQRFGELTDRERVALQQLAAGASRSETAAAMNLNPHTLDYVLRRVYAKLRVSGVTEAVAVAERQRTAASGHPS